MRKIYTLLIILFSIRLSAQIPNASFENWSGGFPVGWYSVNDVYLGQSTTAHAGSSAVEMPVVFAGAFNINTVGTLITGTAAHSFFACTCRPQAVRFWYIFNPADGESLSCEVAALSSDPAFAGSGNFSVQDSTFAVYKEGGINFAYSKTGNADSISIAFQMLPGQAGYNIGAQLIIDDVSFGAPFTSIKDLHQEALVQLEKVQPNPVTTQANIIYTLSAATPVSLEVYNITGRLVKTLVNGKQTPGRYKAILDVTDMPAGTYFYRLTASGNTVADKLCVVK